MKKRFFTVLLAGVMTAAMSMTALAAGWQKNDTGWWYATNDAGTQWYSNGWFWIDDNNDGTAECYYFDSNGYLLVGTMTPDGYTVNADGAWTENGVVQTKAFNVNSTNASVTQENNSVGNTSAVTDKITGIYKTTAIYDKFGDEVMEMDPIENWYPVGLYEITLLSNGNISSISWNDDIGIYKNDRETFEFSKVSDNSWYVSYSGVEHTLTLNEDGTFCSYLKKPNSALKDNFTIETLTKVN